MHGAPRPTKALPPGALLLERFRLGARLGEGGSNTYRAMDEESGEEVAVELLACMPHPIDMDLVRNAVRPWQEADAIFLPVVHAVEQVSLGQDHCAIVVRELVEGDSLAELAGCCGVLPARAAKTVVARLLEVLRDLAGLDRGLVHGDLNPWNVILRDEDDEMVLVDVGLPKAVARDWSEDGNGSASWAQCVHRDFAAPEAVLATPGPRTDLYGAGGVLLFLLTGKSPLELQLEHGEDLKLQLKKLGVNEHLMVLLEYLLSPTEEGRLASPQQALEMLHSPAACPRGRTGSGDGLAPGAPGSRAAALGRPGRRAGRALHRATAGMRPGRGRPPARCRGLGRRLDPRLAGPGLRCHRAALPVPGPATPGSYGAYTPARLGAQLDLRPGRRLGGALVAAADRLLPPGPAVGAAGLLEHSS